MTKLIEVKSYFKTVSESKTSHPHAGKKRDDLEWSFQGYDAADISALPADDLEKVAVIVNAAIESYGRKLIALPENETNWDYAPAAESLTLHAVHADLTATRQVRRKVTIAALKVCGEFYATYAHLIGKNESQARAGSTLIAEKLRPIAGNVQALEVLQANILELFEKVAEEVENTPEIEAAFEENADCLEWVVEECGKLIEDGSQDLASAL